MRGIYGCGVLDAFLQAGITFPYNIGVSAGAANVASFVARQERRNYRFYTQYAFDERYLSLRNYVRTRSIFGMDFIYDELTDIVDPLDYKKMLSPDNEMVVVATDAVTAMPEYFTKEDIRKERGGVFKASCAIPAMCEPIEIDGRLYFDGGVSDSIPYKKAFDDGCEKVVALLTRPRGFVKRKESARPVYSEMLRDYPQIVRALDRRHIRYNNALQSLYSLEKQGKALVFCPGETMGVRMLTRNKSSLDALYELGLTESKARMREIIGFMSR